MRDGRIVGVCATRQKPHATMPSDTTHLIALAAALGWASGLRLWAVLLLTGGAGALGWITLPPGLHVLENPFMLAAAAAMAAIEFLADKIPAVDSIWDALQTLVRIPGGAALAAGVFGGDDATWVAGAAVLGAVLAAIDPALVMFEAPTKELQVELIRTVGPTVNLGNVATSDVIGVETLRQGLRGDTLLDLTTGVSASHVGAGPARSARTAA